ncbi:hypothetical protein ID388_003966 [Escherichia coli]|nr:hypothetical protein [Escherichia coli]EGH1134788.1 hypothetical protein [Escherichia coli]
MLITESCRITIPGSRYRCVITNKAGGAIDNSYHQREGWLKSLQPWLFGTAAQPFFASPQDRKLFFGNVRTDLIDKTYQRKSRQTRVIAGIVKKTHSTSRLKNRDFSGFMG